MSNKTFEAPSIADLIRLAVELSDSLTPEQHVDTLRGWPDMPSDPGLYALVAPDEITVRVFSLAGGDLPKEVQGEIRRDVASRLQLPDMVEHTRSGKSYAEYAAWSCPRFLALKKQYKLEKLG
jgi:hypothetical protein